MMPTYHGAQRSAREYVSAPQEIRANNPVIGGDSRKCAGREHRSVEMKSLRKANLIGSGYANDPTISVLSHRVERPGNEDLSVVV